MQPAIDAARSQADVTGDSDDEEYADFPSYVQDAGERQRTIEYARSTLPSNFAERAEERTLARCAARRGGRHGTAQEPTTTSSSSSPPANQGENAANDDGPTA